jgi:hypothetical protein
VPKALLVSTINHAHCVMMIVQSSLGSDTCSTAIDAATRAITNTTVTPEQDYPHDHRTAVAALSCTGIVDLVNYQQGVIDSTRQSFEETRAIINSWGSAVPHLITKASQHHDDVVSRACSTPVPLSTCLELEPCSWLRLALKEPGVLLQQSIFASLSTKPSRIQNGLTC